MELARLEGHADLIRRLRKLSGRQLKTVLTKASREALRPMLATAKRLVPVDSGRLRASLAITAGLERGAIVARLAPRRDFRYTSTGKARKVAGYGKQKRRALAKGYSADTTNPLIYARGIEFGRDKSGRIRRRAGPALFLSRAFEAQKAQAMGTLATAIRRHLDNQTG